MDENPYMIPKKLFTAENIITHIPAWFILTISFIFTGSLIRIYEYLIVTQNFLLPENTPVLYFSGLFYDLIFFSAISLLLLPLFLLIRLFNKRIAKWMCFTFMSLILIVYILLIQYFAEVLVPLGSDFFAYNFTEISDTVNTSVDITLSRILPVLLFPVLFGLIYTYVKRIPFSARLVKVGTGVFILLALGATFLTPAQSRYEREIDYSLTANKAQIFASALIGTENSIPEYTGKEYPLLRPSRFPDVLGPHFNQADLPPNIVFIIVESLGGTLVPPHADYPGFTPFLDSLASQSLYWTHFLATSGRSFNAQPSILASLPYGEHGFMDMGFKAPAHHSLISILNNNDYQTSYFGGYDTRFDNLDQFLERQGIDLLMDASRFPDSYTKMDEIEGGFTWGYSDKDTYQRAFDFISQFDTQSPRLDIFFTLNFHEPFIIQDPDLYRDKFSNRLDNMELSSAKRDEYQRYSDIFIALLYTDDAIKELIDLYRKRSDFDRTIFIITGDHRLIPIPHATRIDRYYVPFMIYSPLLKSPQTFEGVSSHLDIAPSLLSFLEKNYAISQPDSVHWLGEGLSISKEFKADRKIPFMRNKNNMPDYLSGRYFLSGGQLFELEPGMKLRPLRNSEIKNRLEQEFKEFKSLNRYVTSNDKIIRPGTSGLDERENMLAEETFLDEQNLLELNTEELFYRARELAFTGQYEDTRLILRHILRQRPNFHDARILFGRTFGWEQFYEQADEQFDEVLRRNPAIADAYAAKADLYYWQNQPERTIEIIDEALTNVESNGELLFRKARALRQKGQLNDASALAEEALQEFPDNENLITLLSQL